MAPYDFPHVAHDMILRFMGVNFSAILDGSARIPSSIGDDYKPVFSETSEAASNIGQPTGKTPQQDKAMWEGTSVFFFFPLLVVKSYVSKQKRITMLAQRHSSSCLYF